MEHRRCGALLRRTGMKIDGGSYPSQVTLTDEVDSASQRIYIIESDPNYEALRRSHRPIREILMPRKDRVLIHLLHEHVLEEHRPLGNMMRARNHAYRLSTQERGASAEPDGSEAID